MEWITTFFDWSNWLVAIKHPLGIAGFSLFLVFLVLTRFRKDSLSRGTRAVFLSMAIISLTGGFFLAWKQMTNTKNTNISVSVGNVTNTGGGSVKIGVVEGKSGKSTKDRTD